MLQTQRTLGEDERNLEGDSVKYGERPIGVEVAKLRAVGQSEYAESVIQRPRGEVDLKTLVRANAVVVEYRQADDCERYQRRQAVAAPREF